MIYDSIEGETSRPPSKIGSKRSISIPNTDAYMAMGEDLEHLNRYKVGNEWDVTETSILR